MRKFKGQINGVEYTDMEKFDAAYKEFQAMATPYDSVNVSYTIEYTEDDCTDSFKDNKNAEPKKQIRGNSEMRKDNVFESLTEEDTKLLCDAVEKIRDIVNDTTGRINSCIEADCQTYRNMREFCVTTDAAITKIRWIVQSLPAKLRRELCNNIYDATKEMVDNINSELVDLRYELSKRQEIISGEINEREKDIREIDEEIEELESEKEDIYTEINERQTEYDRNNTKVETIATATRFFDDLIDSFEM